MTFVFGCFKQVHLFICGVQGVSNKLTAGLKKKLIHHRSSISLKELKLQLINVVFDYHIRKYVYLFVYVAIF